MIMVLAMVMTTRWCTAGAKALAIAKNRVKAIAQDNYDAYPPFVADANYALVCFKRESRLPGSWRQILGD